MPDGDQLPSSVGPSFSISFCRRFLLLIPINPAMKKKPKLNCTYLRIPPVVAPKKRPAMRKKTPIPDNDCSSHEWRSLLSTAKWPMHVSVEPCLKPVIDGSCRLRLGRLSSSGSSRGSQEDILRKELHFPSPPDWCFSSRTGG